MLANVLTSDFSDGSSSCEKGTWNISPARPEKLSRLS